MAGSPGCGAPEAQPRRPYHQDDAAHGQPAAQAGGRLPLEADPAVGRELEHDPLHLAPGTSARQLGQCAQGTPTSPPPPQAFSWTVLLLHKGEAAQEG